MTVGFIERWGIIGKFVMKITLTSLGNWLILNVFSRIDPPLLRLTIGRLCLSGLSGLSIGMLTTTGAKSGAERRVTLLFVPDGGNVILIASAAGSARHPGWYFNLKANPEAHLLYRDYTGSYLAREVEGEERSRLWEKAQSYYPGFDNYQEQATERQIPVMLLERKQG